MYFGHSNVHTFLNFVLQALHVLRPMTHDASSIMRYDERYTPLLKRANLATVARVYHRGLPAWTEEDYADIASSDEGDNPYD